MFVRTTFLSRNSAKILLSASILLQITSVHADEFSRVSLKVKPGTLEAERTALLKDILEVKENNKIGIKAYMSAFEDIENLVDKGVSRESLQTRLDSLENALSKQKTQFTVTRTIKTRPKTMPSKKLLSLEQARLYVRDLVNADRAKYHLAPVTLDSIATAAGQLHTDEMAAIGCCSHWDPAGKKPSQRYTEAGGIHNDSENFAHTFGNCLSKNNLFAAEELESMQRSFMAEKAPRDAHRLQILRPEHNKLGIGVSYFVDHDGESHLCLAQEFVDQYGEYTKLPDAIIRSKPFDVSGCLFPSWTLDRVSINWEPTPKPMTKEELIKTGDYTNGDCSVTEFYAKLEPKIVKVWTKEGRQHFTVRVVPEESWKAGLYYISIWAKSSNINRAIEVSTRTAYLN